MRWRKVLDPADSPKTEIDPPLIFCTPTMLRKMVVLPLPLGPSNPIITPVFIERVKSGIIIFSSRMTRRLFIMTASDTVLGYSQRELLQWKCLTVFRLKGKAILNYWGILEP